MTAAGGALGLPLAVWRSAGHLGVGVGVALLDGGVDPDHPSLARRIDGAAVFDRTGRRRPDLPMNDPTGHGTHVAGLIAEVAPEARLHVAQVIEGGATIWRLLAGLDWALEAGARVIVMPVGFPGAQPVLRPALAAALAAGALPVVAVGNGGAGRVTSPAAHPEALAIGACDKEDMPARFSGSSGADEYPKRPDLLARGVELDGPAPGGGSCRRSGTSMAAAVVGGVVAVLSSATGVDPPMVAETLRRTARALPSERRHRGQGVLDAAAALESLSGRGQPRRAELGVESGGVCARLAERLRFGDPASLLDVVVTAGHGTVAERLARFAGDVSASLPRLNALRLSLRPADLWQAIEDCPGGVFAPANPLNP